MGKVSSRESTFINALLGCKDLLPTGHDQTTCGVTYIEATADTTPTSQKVMIWSALGYFILPVDLIPDLLPVVGFTDDLAAIVACYKTVKANITPAIQQQAKAKLEEWFGNIDDDKIAGYLEMK